MGIRIARGIVATNFAEWIDLSPEYSLVEWKIPAKWAGKRCWNCVSEKEKELML